MPDVSIAKCADYSPKTVESALQCALDAIDGLSFVRPGMTVGIKANLVSAMRPDAAATTHPQLLAALTALLRARGAEVIVGDSPGGLYNAIFVNRVYAATGLSAAQAAGATLNQDFSQRTAHFPEGRVLRHFQYTGWLDGCDALIDFCKLKSHGMMGMSAAAKNLFGAIPGTLKPEYHYHFPNHMDFAKMLIDLNDYFRPVLSIADAVVGMEGNGPTAGTPRFLGAILAAKSPHMLDLACAKMLGLRVRDVPTLQAALEAGYIPARADDLDISGPLDAVCVRDFRLVSGDRRSIAFDQLLPGRMGKLAGRVVRVALDARPTLNRTACVRCGKCRDICQPRAISMPDGYPVIDRAKCIRCFCCQEFCPKGAMQVGRNPLMRLLER